MKILGYLPPKKTKTKWYLSILENLSGVTERYPKFRPTEDVVVRSYFRLHMYNHAGIQLICIVAIQC